MPPINVLIKPASGLCNLRCEYCFYCDEMQNRAKASFGFMSADVLETVIQKALFYADRICSISFQGGEPSLMGLPFFEQVIDLEKKHNKKAVKIYNSIQTNGIAIDEELASFFAQNRFLVGLSLDGVENSHNSYRKDAAGNDTFARVMETAQLFDKNRVEYNILTVVNTKTAVSAERIYRFYRRRGFRYLQFIACLDPIGAEPGGHGYSLTPELYGRFLCDLFDMWYEDFRHSRQPYIRGFENYIRLLCGLEAESCDMRGECGPQYVIEADGSVYPCDFYVLDEFRLGSLITDDFPAIDDICREIGFMQESREKPIECGSCDWYMLCRSGCKRHRFIQDSQMRNYFCTSYLRFFRYAGKRMNKIAESLKK